MPIESSTFYWIACDHCGKQSNEEDGYLAGRRDAAIGDAAGKGWRIDSLPSLLRPAGKFTCPLCLEEPGWHKEGSPR